METGKLFFYLIIFGLVLFVIDKSWDSIKDLIIRFKTRFNSLKGGSKKNAPI